MNPTFKKFVRLTKVNEALREVSGVVTAELPDKEGEICHYETTAPYYKTWSDELAKATEGKNLGNLRIMHTLSAAGVGKALVFDDAKKEIYMTFKVVDDSAWKGVQEGMFTGFSQGGEYMKTWVDEGKKYYTARPSEVSLVDNPCLEAAHFEYVKADGQVELRKFAPRSEAMEITQELLDKLTKSVMESIKKAEPVATKVKPTRANVDKAVNAIIKSRAEVKKSLYTVAEFAYLLCDLAWLQLSTAYEAEYEGDGSELPNKLREDLSRLADTFLAMAEEEATELKDAAVAKAETGGLSTMNNTATAPKAEPESIVKSVIDIITKSSAAQVTELSKLLGSEQANELGAGEPKPIDLQAKGTENIQSLGTAEKAMTKEEIEKAIKAGIEAGLQHILKAMTANDDEEEDDNGKPNKKTNKAAPASGVGDRTETVLGGPVVRVMPVTKVADSAPSAAVVEKAEPVDMDKALGGDTHEALRFMKGVKSSGNVPDTVASAFVGRRS